MRHGHIPGEEKGQLPMRQLDEFIMLSRHIIATVHHFQSSYTRRLLPVHKRTTSGHNHTDCGLVIDGKANQVVFRHCHPSHLEQADLAPILPLKQVRRHVSFTIMVENGQIL